MLPAPGRIVALALVALAALAGPGLAQEPAPTPEPRFSERVEVERLLLDVRILDSRGQALLGLTPADLRVKLDGRPAPIDSVQWVSGSEPFSQGLPPERAAAVGAPAAPPGRLIVLLFQWDLESSRSVGLLRMRYWTARLVERLHPGDRVALLSFDSHLKLWADFSPDRARLRQALAHDMIFGSPPELAPGEFPSLARHLDLRAARRAASLESALLVVGRALSRLPGAKTLALFGWGMGRLAGPVILVDADYAPAVRALGEARTTVISLDVTDADHHTLEMGLQEVASETGGFFARTHLFPATALARLEGTLAGHYVLAVEAPPGGGTRRIEVELVGRRGDVLTPRRHTN